ncbi:hypothetical protein E5O84_06405 [Neisseria gonorrhoeae]
MTYLKVIAISIVLYILLLQINLKMLEKRIDFLVENIDKYYQQYGSYPNNFDFISTETDFTTESYCDFWDKNIAGYGNCYFVKNDKDYTILVMGFSSKILFSSHNKIKEFNSNKYD